MRFTLLLKLERDIKTESESNNEQSNEILNNNDNEIYNERRSQG